MTNVIDAFSDEQIEFCGLAADVFGTSASREELAEIGLPLLAVPEELGGGGMAEPDVTLIIEEAGYADVIIPIAETVGVVAPMLARYGSAELRERWLQAFARGDSLGSTLCPSSGLGSRHGADVALVEQDDWVHVLDIHGQTVSGVLGEPEASVAEFRARGAWVTAALLNGVARRLLSLSIEYASTREQFGVVIGSFQALKHMLAEMAAAIESARPTAWKAARALAAADPTSAVAASVAKVLAGQAESLVNDYALQIHGGIGFTREHPVHRWLLFGHELEQRWGDTTTHQALLGRFALDCDALVATFTP